MMTRLLLGLLLWCLMGKAVEGLELDFAPYIFSCNMTLQMEPEKIQFWGTATPGLGVSVEIEDRGTWSTTALDDGTWSLETEPQAVGYDLTVSLSAVENENTQTLMRQLHHVTIGRVFLCSGQSNMEMSVNAACVEGPSQCQAEIDDSVNYPYLRMFTVHHDNSSAPLEYLRSPPAPAPEHWLRSEPSSFNSVTESGMTYPSAACYFFGRELYKLWNGTIPIGLISSTWGGTRIQSWTRKEVMKAECDYPDGGSFLEKSSIQQAAPQRVLRGHEEPAKNVWPIIADEWETPEGAPVPGMALADASLYNAMIHPLRHMSISGFAWYQGEANQDESQLYECLFPAMISDWRKQFNVATAPFAFVQLAPCMNSRDELVENVHFEDIRQAQAKGGLERVKNTYMAVTLDLGDLLSPLTPIHPRLKQDVGSRLARGMYNLLGKDLDNVAKVMDSGPNLQDKQIVYEDDGEIKVVLSFDPTTSQGLHAKGGADCEKVGDTPPWCCEEYSPFSILEQTGTTDATLVSQWQLMTPGSYHIQDNQVEISFHRSDIKGRAVRLGLHWRTNPACVLFNQEGLPAAPFVIDL